MQKIKLDYIGSVLKNVPLAGEVMVNPGIKAMAGEAVVVEVLGAQKQYGELELVSGRIAKMRAGDLVAGALGERKALNGIVGVIPKTVLVGDALHILNLGGLVGAAISWNKEVVSQPVAVKVIGSIVNGAQAVNIHQFSLKPQTKLKVQMPIVAVVGTAMGVGKTTVVSELIHALVKKQGLTVAAAKLTGVAAQRDILAMADVGAKVTLTFQDIGLTSTINQHNGVIPATKTILNTLAESKPQLMVVELGDGIIGWYGVEKLLADPEFIRAISFTIVCCHDLVGAVGAVDLLAKYGLTVDFFAGPVANNTAGTDYLEQIVKIPAADVREDQFKLLAVLSKKPALVKLLVVKEEI